MPTYEYVCQHCHSPVSIWFRSFAAAATETPVCTTCSSTELKRQMSTCAFIRSSSQTGRHASAPSAGKPSEDTQSLARIMREAGAGRDAGRDAGNDFNEIAARLERGESSQAIEASLRKRVGERMQPH